MVQFELSLSAGDRVAVLAPNNEFQCVLVLQCVAVCCMLQCVAVCCSVLQCAAVVVLQCAKGGIFCRDTYIHVHKNRRVFLVRRHMYTCIYIHTFMFFAETYIHVYIHTRK